MVYGTIFNIQKFSVHDGPGIRTTVFFKGCPLNCWWCHNPESQDADAEIMYWDRKCLKCGTCIRLCPQKALDFAGDRIIQDKERCRRCGVCVKSCQARAVEFAGRKVASEYVMKEIMKDRIFYDESGGGVTFSGGEPLMQPEFLYELLLRCREEGLHTALDTTGFTSWDILERMLGMVDLFLYDVKLMDSEKHRKYTGVPNDTILGNLRRLSERNCRVNARVPVIPGINDDVDNIEQTGKFLTDINISQVNILPYHNIAVDKYNRLSRTYELIDLEEPAEETMTEIARRLKEYGLSVKIGG